MNSFPYSIDIILRNTTSGSNELMSCDSGDSINTLFELKNGFVRDKFVGPKSTITGVPTIFARCTEPVSFPITKRQEDSSSAS